nr:NUDIX hydrolase [uncultured Blautia sp.]
MGKINQVKKMTDNLYLNLYNVKATSIHNTPVDYYVASRAKTEKELKLSTGENPADGVIIYSLYGEKRDRVVLIRQYRYPIGTYAYEFPAGLVEKGEDYHDSAVRELYEETGLTLTPLEVDEAYQKPYFTSVGMSDEACAAVYGYASGTVSTDAQEASEEIQVVLADRKEVKRILREERVSIMCAYMLMHFLKDDKPFSFLKVLK